MRFILFLVVVISVVLLAILQIGAHRGVTAAPLVMWVAFGVVAWGLARLPQAHIQRAGLMFAQVSILLTAAPHLGIQLVA